MKTEVTLKDAEKHVAFEVNGVAMSIRRASHAVTRLYNASLKPVDLRITQFATLATLQGLGCADVTRLAEALGVDRTTLARNLRLLEAMKLVEIVCGADRRQRIVTLTSQGTQVLAAALPLWERVERQVVESIGREQWSLLRAELTTVAEQARQFMSR